jgi:ATP-binding cassette subfamily B protein/subfamily B ATP-binding cassette protein MsbA
MRRQLRLFRYVWPHWRALSVVLLTMVLHIGLHVLRPWPLKFLLDDVLVKRRVPESLRPILDALPGPSGLDGLLLWVCIATVLLYFAGTLVEMVSTLVTVTFGQRMVYDLGADLFRHLERLGLLFHSRQPVGDTVSRVTGDAYCVQILVCSVLLPLLEAVVSLVTMFAIMWCIEPTMTLLSLGVVPVMVVLMWLFSGPMRERGRTERDLEGRMMTQVEQTLSAIPAVQAFTREEREHQTLRACAADTVVAHRRATQVDMLFKVFIGLVTAVGTAVIMWLGARYALMPEPTVSVGTIVIFLSYLESLYEPLNAIAHSGSTMQHAAGSADRVLEILDTPPEVSDAPGARAAELRGHVRYEDVTFGYEPGRPVLHGISLEARPGEVIAIVGPTGAGKTTLVNMLVRFFDPWSGRVTVDGRDVRQYPLQSLRRQVALVLQEPYIFPITLAENISYGRPDAGREEVEAAARAANADGYIRRIPGGYDAVVGERGATLSGGEKQRLSIARAFLKDAPILILDEPTSALDARTEALLLDALEHLMKDRTTFIIAHRLSTIRHADRILVINHGAVIEQGSHEELMALDGLYAGLYRQQMDLARHDLAADPASGGRQPPVAAQTGG